MSRRLSAETRNKLARDVGERIKQMRLLRGWSQAAFGKKVCMHAQAIQRIEKGRTLPNLETLYILAKGLRMEMDCLIPEGY